MNLIIAAQILAHWGYAGGPDWEDALYNEIDYWKDEKEWDDHHCACLYAFLVEHHPEQLTADELVSKWEDIIHGL